MNTLADAQAALREHFGFDAFRETQAEVITSILEGRDTIVVMPTGGGKSLCYQLPALMRPGATVVISPLIALMKDQVDALHARGLPATFINSSLDYEEQRARINGIRRGEYKLVYVAPERFRSQSFTAALRDATISFFAVDEAHCVSSWGHDFRPDYLRLKDAIEELGRPQTVALTATATPYVRADIIEQLALREPVAYVSGFDRPNLSIRVAHTEKEPEKITYMRTLAARHAKGSGIVYTSTRKSVEQVARKLQTAGVRAVAYHAGMDDADRVQAQDAFMSGTVQVIVATNAFGMGIDKPDIRFVIHHHLPGSVEAYYQEIGRAGRDGAPSDCVLLFNYADKRTQDFFIEGSFPQPETIARVYESLAATGREQIELSTSEIANRANLRNEMAVQSALVILEKAGHIERGAGGENRGEVKLLTSPQAARAAVSERRSTTSIQVLNALIGDRPPRQGVEFDINVADLSLAADLDITQTKRALGSLVSAGVIAYQPARRTRGVRMLDQPPAKTLRIRPADIARRAALEQRKLREVINFCYTEECFRRFILNYFGDRSLRGDCGKCGNCLKRSPDELAASEHVISSPRQPPVVEGASDLDRLRLDTAPFATDLDAELAEASRLERRRLAAEAEGGIPDDPEAELRLTTARDLTADEQLDVRKILACAARMNGRFGKGLLIGTLRGSRSVKITQVNLDKLSTYGILAHRSTDEITSLVDALVSAGALRTTGGAYPTIALTASGGEVMRERQSIKLALPARIVTHRPAPIHSARPDGHASHNSQNGSTVDETYALYKEGLTIEEISERRSLVAVTIEKHLADCILEDREIDVSQFVSEDDYALIVAEVERHGADRLKPLRDALPQRINYRMIRFTIADLQRRGQLRLAEPATS